MPLTPKIALELREGQNLGGPWESGLVFSYIILREEVVLLQTSLKLSISP
jgi:hypothetical protein